LSDSFSNKLCLLQKDYVQDIIQINDFVTDSVKLKKCTINSIKYPGNQIKIHNITEAKGFLPIQLLPPLSPIKEQKLTQPIKLTKPVQTINKKQLNYMLKRILN